MRKTIMFLIIISLSIFMFGCELPSFSFGKQPIPSNTGKVPTSDFSYNDYFDDGMILPQCFCDFKYGESFFRDAHHYFHMLSKDLEANGEIAKRLNDLVFYTDEELYSAISLHTRKIYGISNPQQVEAGQKIEIAKKMHHDYNCSNKQIQRILKLDQSVLNSLFPQSASQR